MAVKDILPNKNLRAVDIRDTLLAHGADWSNVEGNKSANYLPNYFKKEANINKWSRYKPVDSPIDNKALSNADLEEVNWGFKIITYDYGLREKMYKDYMSGVDQYEYALPSNVLRLSDFAGYYPSATSPIDVIPDSEVDCQGTTELNTSIRPFPLDNEFGFNEIAKEFVHHGVRIRTKDGKVIWTTSPIDWEKIKLILPSSNTDAEFFEFMSTEPFYEFSGEPIGASLVPLQHERNPYVVKLKITRPPRIELIGQVFYEQIGAETARLYINYTVRNIWDATNTITLGDLNVHSKLDWNDYYTFIAKDPIAGEVLAVGEEYSGSLKIDISIEDIDFTIIKLEMTIAVGDYETETYSFEDYPRPYDMKKQL